MFLKGGIAMFKKAIPILLCLAFSSSRPFKQPHFPEKEVQIFIPWAAGGATDLIFRALAATTGTYRGKAVAIVNKPGGGGAVGYTEGMKAAPDGYTLKGPVTALTILPHQLRRHSLTRTLNPSSM